MVTGDLLEYIRSQMQAGKNSADIRTFLSSQGWSQDEIEDAFAQANDGSYQVKQKDGSGIFERYYGGRIGRKTFAIIFFPCFILEIFTAWLQLYLLHFGQHLPELQFNTLAVIGIMINTILFLVNTSIFIRRLHDLGWSGWAIFGFWLPIINLFAIGMLLFRKGEAKDNQYGRQLN